MTDLSKFLRASHTPMHRSDSDPSRRVLCDVCQDTRYTTFPVQDYAQAKRCESCLGKCDKCGGEGFHFVEKANGYRYVRECENCTNIDRRIATFNNAKLPARYHDKGFYNFRPHKNQTIEPNGNLPSVSSYAMSRAHN
ncbi:MAG: hypothetical protein AAFS10_02465, partial [Myxococcota bacterium]